MPTRLSDQSIKRLQPGQFLRDEMVRGFYARMGAGGRASFEVRREGRRKFFRIIGTSDVLSASKAREVAKKLLAEHTLAQHSPAPKNFTLETAWVLHEPHLRTMGKSPRTIEHYKSALERLTPEFKKRTLRELSEHPELMIAEHTRIKERTDDKKAYRQKGHGPIAADATARTVRAVYLYARTEDESLPRRPPTSKIKLEFKKSNKLLALAPGDFADWWRRIQRLENPIRQRCYLFCLLSGLRRTSLIEMRWEDMSADQQFFHIPKPKGGEGRAFDLFLSEPMRTLLNEVQEEGWRQFGQDSERAAHWVWPAKGTRSGHLTGLEADSRRIRTQINGHWGVYYNLHALRRTYTGVATLVRVNDELSARLLNHASEKPITAHYVRTETIGSALMDAQERISTFVMDNITGKAADDAVAEYERHMRQGQQPD